MSAVKTNTIYRVYKLTESSPQSRRLAAVTVIERADSLEDEQAADHGDLSLIDEGTREELGARAAAELARLEALPPWDKPAGHHAYLERVQRSILEWSR
jgi:hypothetical protein